VQDFSHFMTTLLHLHPGATEWDLKLQRARFDYVTSSAAMARTIAENYVGLEEV
jgi:p-hydroxybenzoate 3-monooxygenase